MRQVIIFETDHERGLAAEALANEWLIAHPKVNILKFEYQANVSLAANDYTSGSETHQSICILYNMNGFDAAIEVLRERT